MCHDIESKYGVKLFYGEQTNSYRPKGKVLLPLREQDVAEHLAKIDGVPGSYPTGFFCEYSTRKVKLSLYLIGEVQDGSFTGLVESIVYIRYKNHICKRPCLYVNCTS